MQDFAKDDVKLFRRSLAFYEGLAARLGAAGHCLDVFACSLDQVGLAEMHPAVASTGRALLRDLVLHWQSAQVGVGLPGSAPVLSETHAAQLWPLLRCS